MEHMITLNLPESVYQVLVRRAEQAGQPPEVLAIELLASATVPETADPLEAFIGAFDSQGTDWADRHDTHLGKSLQQKLQRG
jgi:hypothetical protein